jgi:L-2-hydroxycarboxylate dehydrogenase (NAD+)
MGDAVAERKIIYLDTDRLRSFIEQIFRSLGCDSGAAEMITDVFVEADLRGVGLQGIDHIHTMVGAIQKGHIDLNGRPSISKEGPAFAIIDGGSGPGQLAAMLAADVAAAKAHASGTCSVAIVNSSDIFMLGYYAERMARAGVVGFVFTGSPPQVHPYGGVEPLLGTNPLAIAFPTSDGRPVIIDMSTSALSGSRVRQATYFDQKLPAGIGVNARGEPTTDPSEIRAGGAISPLAGHKGYALGLGVGLLSGPLIGAQIGRGLQGWFSLNTGHQGNRGHLMLAIDPAAFGDPQDYRRAVTEYVNDIGESRKAEGVESIRIPGERGFETRERSLRDGIAVYQLVWDKALKLAEELKVPVPPAIHLRTEQHA